MSSYGSQKGLYTMCSHFSAKRLGAETVMVAADGFGYRYSSHRARLNNTKGQNIDEGIEPDYLLEAGDFFDIAKVGKLIEQFYAK